jgi:hypothetical protein
MGRGGHRDGAGRKSGWNHADTQTIRVPKVFAVQLMDIARQLDLGESENLMSPILSEVEVIQPIVESGLLQVNPDQMDIFSLISEVIESVSESKTTSLSMRGLAEHLGIHHSSISRKLKKQPLEEVLSWIQEKGKGAWIFDSELKRFTQVSEDLDCEDF